MPFVGFFAKEAAQLCPTCHLQFGQSTDMLVCSPLDIQGLGVVRPGMIGQSLNGQHWLLTKMGCPTL